MSECNTCADVDAQGSELMLDLTKTFAEQYSITPPVGTQFKVSVASESQPFLETNYKGLVHPVPVGAIVRYLPGDWHVVDGECYPTDCQPCTTPIDFPENPKDGERYCVPIGSSGESKCWFYDKCVPGWRAEGPSAAATAYLGTVDVCSEDPHENPKAGDFYVQKITCTSIRASWGLTLSAMPSISQGTRIAYNGTTWQPVAPPTIPYAEEARDGDKPDPDDRIGGIVKNATVGQVVEGTDKCDTVTPYTLREGLKVIIPAPSTVQVTWGDNITEKFVPISTEILELSIVGSATHLADDGTTPLPVVGEWVFKYYSVADNGDETEITDVTLIRSESGGFGYEDTYLKDFTITPVTATRKIKGKGIFYDVYGNPHTAETAVLDVKYCNAMKITTQPADINTQPTNTDTDDKLNVELSTQVVVEAFSTDLPFDASKIQYQWYVWNYAISGANDPDLDYTFADWQTNTLKATRTNSGAETVQLSVRFAMAMTILRLMLSLMKTDAL